MKLRIIRPEVNAIENSWGYEYDFSDTMEIDLLDDYLIDKIARVIDNNKNVASKDVAWKVMHCFVNELKELTKTIECDCGYIATFESDSFVCPDCGKEHKRVYLTD